MANEWPMRPINYGASVYSGFAFKSEEFSDVGIQVVKIKNVNNRTVDLTDTALFPATKLTEKHAKFFLRDRDVLIAMTGQGSVGRVGRVRLSKNKKVLLNQRVGKFSVVPNRLDMDYLFYTISTPHYEKIFFDAGSGSGQPNLSPQIIGSIEIPFPPLEEQRAIAHILGTLDDKIELNRRMNETLEAMARALFKAWFVDFEPVRAKLSGRWRRGQSLPGLPAHLYDLFPDRLVDSELGEIPEGWEVQHIADIGTIICGKTPSTKNLEYYGNDVPFITIPEMHGNIFAIDIKKRLSQAGADSQAKKMLPSGSICVSCIATLGLVTITTATSQTNQQINSIVPFEKDAVYYWYWRLKDLGMEIKAGGSGGSVLGNLSTGRFSKIKVNASNKQLRLAYNANVQVLFSRILENARESILLENIRGAMLPKLISGELCVLDAK